MLYNPVTASTKIGEIRTRRIQRALAWMYIDGAVVVIAYTLAHVARTLSLPSNLIEHVLFLTFAVMAMVISAYFAGVYHQLWNRTSGQGVVFLLTAYAATTAATLFVDLVMYPRPMPLSVVLMGNTLALVGMTAFRYRSRLITGLSWRWKAIWEQEFPMNTVRVMIIGAGESGEAVARRMRNRTFGQSMGSLKKENYKVVGFIDDDPHKQGYSVEGYRVMGSREDIPHLVKENKVDMLIFAIHNIDGESFRHIQNLCWDANVKVKMVPDTVGVLDELQPTALNLRDVKPEDILGRSQISRHEAVDLSPVTDKVVLVTGAAGSIGSELSRQMATYNPTKLLLLDNNESALHNLHVEIAARYPDIIVKPILTDVTNREVMRVIFERYLPQVIFHAAAYKHVPMMEWYPNEAIRVNVGGTRTVAELAQDFSAERFVLVSTDKAVHPSSVMGASKRLCELVVRALSQQEGHNTLFTAVRFGNVLGSRGSVLPTFIRQLNNGGPLTVTDKRMTRYFMSIPEAVNLVIHAACLTKGDDIFLLRMGESVRIWDIAERVIRMHGLRPNVDIDIVEIGIRPGEKLAEELHAEDEDPTDTEHPSIFKLKDDRDELDNNAFFHGIDQLLSANLSGGEDALDVIMQVTELNVPLEQIA